ncbi:indole-3-glycerol phosphate synthase [Desulfitispora alkaliphila]|uniref:indole-3-glycerol phosphate synthase TrpC n=1 Tax=Desulfitispora alkaliphila TaxID=622674 RepID=UPI003D1F9D63
MLDTIISYQVKKLEQLERMPIQELEYRIEAMLPPNSFQEAIAKGKNHFNIIAEIKKASPSKGDLINSLNLARVVSDYELGGAAAISVLTEEDFFKGSLEDLKDAAVRTNLPLLRKDFIIDEYQLYEARLAGASAVLLIVAALPQQKLRFLINKARELKLDSVVEIHNREELHRALDAGAHIIGINNRDLSSFQVNIKTTLNLAQEIPNKTLVISESGITNHNIDAIIDSGVDAALIGESLITASAGNRRSLLRKMTRSD